VKKNSGAAFLAALLLLFLLPSCRNSPGPSSPAQTPCEALHSYLQAEKTGDWGRLYELEWKPGEREDFIETRKLLSSVGIKSFEILKDFPDREMSDFTGISLREDEERLLDSRNLSVEERRAELQALRESYSLRGAIVLASVTYADGQTFDLKYFLIMKKGGWKVVTGLRASR
jgi:hypothetical protein